MNIVILLGAPGSGKGTVAGRLAAEHSNLKHVSSGDLLRGAVAKGTAAGKEAGAYMEAGKLVPDALIATMIKDVVAETTGDVTMLLDGFPRNLAQAKILDEMMSGKSIAVRTVRCGVKSIANRQSTAQVSHAGHLVQRALAYISKHACEGISAIDVVRHLRVSRALADRRFRELQKTSINEAVVERQLAEVCRRLIATNEPIEKITFECGWSSPNYPKRLFKRRYRMTMREFRRLNSCR